MLIILDCCFSGIGGAEALIDSMQDIGNPKVWLIASASKIEYAQEGRFAAALRKVLLDPPAGRTQPLLSIEDTVGAVNEILHNADQRARAFSPRGETVGVPPFFPNSKFEPSVAGFTVSDQHWVSKMRGTPTESATSPYITGSSGRVTAISDLAEWMRAKTQERLAVVTGSAGSGKSAILSLAVLMGNVHHGETTSDVSSNSLLSHAGAFLRGPSDPWCPCARNEPLPSHRPHRRLSESGGREPARVVGHSG